MNKELIKNNIEAFKHWLNGGKLLGKWSNSTEWQDFTNYSWTLSEPEVVLIVIDDEYSELRRAQAEGKIIQFCNTSLGRRYWIDWQGDPFKEDISKLRIKSDKPSFKPGDWITNGTRNIQFSKDNEGFGLSNSYKLWEPKQNEWCVFWNSEEEEHSLHVEQYTKMNEYGHYVTTYTNSWLHAKPIESLQSLSKGNIDASSSN